MDNDVNARITNVSIPEEMTNVDEDSSLIPDQTTSEAEGNFSINQNNVSF